MEVVQDSMRAPATMSAQQTMQIYMKELKYELTKLLRERSYIFSIFGFPIAFFVVFGLANDGQLFHGYPVTRYLIASYSCFGAMGAALFAIGGGLAAERGNGWLELKRASPMPIHAYLFSKLCASVLFAITLALILLGIASLSINLQMSVLDGLHFLLAVAGGAITFASLGVLMGLLMPANAGGMINFVYLPLSLCGGLWMPLEMLPVWLQRAAPLLPSYHYSRLTLHTLGYFNESELKSWLILALYALVFSSIAAWLFRRQEATR